MDFNLSDEQKQIVDMTRDFVRRELPAAQRQMSQMAFPYEAWRKWSDLGMAGLLLPETYGGAGQDVLTFSLCLEEVGAVSQTFGVLWQIHAVVSRMIASIADEAQKQQWLPQFASGRWMPSLALTEESAGSDAAAIQTRAVKQPDGSWVLSGRKIFVSNVGSDLSNGTVVVAVTGVSKTGRNAVSCFLVPRDTQGFTLGQSFPKMAWHGVDNREVLLEDVRLPPEALLGTEGAGLKQALGALNLGRVAIATLSCALIRACLDEALGHAQNRRQFGKPLSAFQITQVKLANTAARAEMARTFVRKVAWDLDRGADVQRDAAIAKLMASQFAVQSATDAFQIHGGAGFMTDTPVNRLYREAQILEIGEGTSEVLQLLIARSIGC